jgi:hypothetical protein
MKEVQDIPANTANVRLVEHGEVGRAKAHAKCHAGGVNEWSRTAFLVWLLPTALGVVGCSGNNGTQYVQVEPPARGSLEGRFEPGPSANCTSLGPMFSVGEVDDPSALVSRVGIRCAVVPRPDGAFDIDAAVYQDRPEGTFELLGRLTPSGDGSHVGVAAANDIQISPYYQNDGACSVAFSRDGDGVTPGKLVGEVTCPAATTVAGRECKVTARFRFDSCSRHLPVRSPWGD